MAALRPLGTHLRDGTPDDQDGLERLARYFLRRRWAELIRRIYEVDPLRCPRCGGSIWIAAFITKPRVPHKILWRLAAKLGAELSTVAASQGHTHPTSPGPLIRIPRA